MTSNGLNAALNTWFKAYESHFGRGAFFNVLAGTSLSDVNKEEE